MTTAHVKITAAGLADLNLSADYTVVPTVVPYIGGPVPGSLPWQKPPKDDGTETGRNNPWASFPQSAAPSNYAGDLILGNQAAQDYKNLVFTGQVLNKRSGTTGTRDRFFNCEFRGTSPGAAITSYYSNSGSFEVWDSLFSPPVPSTYDGTDAIIGHDFTIGRCTIEHTVDGLGIYNTTGPDDNVFAYANLFHKFACYLKDPGHACNGVKPGPSHNDALAQPQNGNKWRLQWNTVRGWADTTVADGATWVAGCAKCSESVGTMPKPNTSSCIQMNTNSITSPAAPTTNGAYIVDNDFDGGRICINLNATVAATVEAVARNIFGFNTSHIGSKQVAIGKVSLVTIKDTSDNIWADGTKVVVVALS